MCVIIVKQKSKPLSREVAKTSARINPHGLGIVWLDTFEVTRHKSNEYSVLLTEENKHRPYIAHFRYATIGKICPENTHPFVCGQNTDELLMMNGTIQGLGNSQMTDSEALAIALGKMPRQSWKGELSKYDCRFVSINTRTRSFQIYNRELFTYRDGVWFSKANVLQDNVIGVYGTLKKGHSNYYHYLRSAKFVGTGQTKDKYPLIQEGLPYMVNKKGIGHNVTIDVFKLSDASFKDIDALEGHPTWYKRERVPVVVKGKEIMCWVYFNPIELQPHHKFLKSYEQSYSIGNFRSKSTNVEYKTYREPVKKFNQISLFDDCNDNDFSTGISTTKCCTNSGCNERNIAFDGWGNYYCESCGRWYQ